jgi:UDP-glucose 4-epimerase
MPDGRRPKMRILVTGARGFIGRYLARHLSSQGHDVAGIGHGAWSDSERAAWYNGKWLNGDISSPNLDVLASACGMPEAIFHLAGGSAVGPSFTAPAEDFHRSVVATSELLEWVRLRAPAARVVMASSAAVYGASHNEPITESAECVPFSPYGYHKRMAELDLESYAHNFGMRVGVVRLFSIYGPELRKQLLWDLCNRLGAGESDLTLGGDGTELRDWLGLPRNAGHGQRVGGPKDNVPGRHA